MRKGVAAAVTRQGAPGRISSSYHVTRQFRSSYIPKKNENIHLHKKNLA